MPTMIDNQRDRTPRATGVFLRVRYTDGSEFEVPAEGWAALPGEGVDEIAICTNVTTCLSGQSIYWVYPEDGAWVMGGAPAGYGQLPPEVVVSTEHTARPIRFMPDLLHRQVKLGHWWPGGERS